jgi:pSer/pThr/pTyr-binding forkhead associated (FHA) protein
MVSETREWALVEGSNIVGRESGCSICIDSPTLSRRHACVVIDGDGATLEDLGSKNGTYLNRRRVTRPVDLNDGDRVQVGSAEMVYRTGAMLPSTLTRHIS